MATIYEKTKDGKIVSFKFKACVGRDENKKQVFRCITWYPDKGMAKSKSRREAIKRASIWEQKAKQEFLSTREITITRPSSNQKQLSFSEFVNDIWKPLAVNDGEHRSSTVAMYQYILKLIIPFFHDTPLQEITSIQITQYLQWLRKEYRTSSGKPVSASTVKHHYDILRIIFIYAEKNDFIQNNPIHKVEPPKLRRKKVDALSIEEANVFFQALKSCNLEVRCVLMLLITMGLRRGECLGLQWKDINFITATASIQRSVTYTSLSGIEVKSPKTENSVREVPLMQSVLELLLELRIQRQNQFPNTAFEESYLFCKVNDPFAPMDPNRITKITKRIFKKAGLPDMSPHDLRHSCATLLLASGADIKSVQEILGHADARTTLNYYARADLKQTRSATNKYAEVFGL